MQTNMFEIPSGTAISSSSLGASLSEIPGLIRSSNTDRAVNVAVTTKETMQMNAANYRMAPVYTPGGGYSCADLNVMGARPDAARAASACYPTPGAAMASIRGAEWEAMRSGIL